MHTLKTGHSPFKCSLGMTKVKQSQQQDIHIGEIPTKCKSKSGAKYYYLNEHWIVYRKLKDGPDTFHTDMVPQAL